MRRAAAITTALLALALLGRRGPRRRAFRAERPLSSGWEFRVEPAAPAPPQPAPPEETAPEGAPPSAPPRPPAGPRRRQASGSARACRACSTRARLPSLFPGTVRRYRVTFRGPPTPRGFSWLLSFESVRRNTAVYPERPPDRPLLDPYTPFTVPARGLRPGRRNELVVIVDGRKNPKLPEAWWNWNGIVRPVTLVPAGRAHVADLGTMSKLRCRGPARGCRAELLIDGLLERRGDRPIKPALEVRLRSPGGRSTRRVFRLPAQRAKRRRLQLSMPVPAPELWSPDAPRLYSAAITLRDRGRVVQSDRRHIGLRSVEVKQGHIWLNNRRIQLRGASIHEDMPGSGAALTGADMDRIVSDLKDLGANVTRAHYLLNERLLDRLDRAGIMVWNQAPIWQRDARAHILWQPKERERALLSVRRTVTAGRSHPSVLTHSVANELTFTPDAKPGTERFLLMARPRRARSTRRSRSRSTSRAGPATASSSPTTRSTSSASTSTSAGTAGSPTSACSSRSSTSCATTTRPRRS